MTALEFGKKQAGLGLLVIATTLIWAWLFSLAGITVNDLFTFKFDIVLAKILTIEFLAFLLAIPLPTTIMAVLTRKMEKANLIIISMAATVIAEIAAMVLFPSLQGFWILATAYLAAVPLSIETAYIKYSELKNWVTTRTAIASTAKVVTLLSIGFFVLSVSTILPQQEQYVEKFEGFLLDFTQGFTTGKSQQAMSTGAADMIVETQIETINIVVNNNTYEKLKGKEDPDVIAFVAIAEAATEYIKSPAYKQEITEKFGQASTKVINNMDVISLIKKQFPMFEAIEKFLWLFHALTLIGIYSLMATIISKPASVVYAVILEEATDLFDKEPKETWENKKQGTTN